MQNNEPPSDCICELCSDKIGSDGDAVYSTDEHTILCHKCYAKQPRCSGCNERNAQSDLEELKDDEFYCSSCYDSMRVCYACSNTIDIDSHRYFYYNDEYYCSGCARDNEAYCCENCSETITIAEYANSEGEGFVNDYLCYPCWERKGESSHIIEERQTTIEKSTLDQHYWRGGVTASAQTKREWAAHKMFFDDFYNFCSGEYEHNDFALRKGALGYGEYGWFKTNAEISTSINNDFADFIYGLIRDENLVRPHKKIGMVQPFAEAFQKHTVFYLTDEKYKDKEKQMMWKYPLDENGKVITHYVDYVARDELLKCIKNRIMPDGSPLIKKMSKLLRSNNKKIWERWSQYRRTWRNYKTNAMTLNIPMRIGFDTSAQKNVVQFNNRVGACQNDEYRETLGFNQIVMCANPHLYLLFYDPENSERIIGRSVIRLFYRRNQYDIDKKTLFVMPSRLYLDKFTHAKNDLYAAMFKGLNEWLPIIKQSFKVDEAVLGAYKVTRHDGTSVYEYLKMSKDDDLTIVNSTDSRESLASLWYYPIWLERPSEEAYWSYYSDEYQSQQVAECSSDAQSRWAMRDTYTGDIAYIGVNQ